jgi:hypothetical protein
LQRRLLTIVLLDNREIVRHIDQLRPRLTSGEPETLTEAGAEDTWTSGDVPNTQTGELESAEAEPTNAETSGTQPDPPVAETPDATDQTTVDSLAEPPESQSDSGEQTTTPLVRRSARVKHPLDRYEGQSIQTCICIVRFGFSDCKLEGEEL